MTKEEQKTTPQATENTSLERPQTTPSGSQTQGLRKRTSRIRRSGSMRALQRNNKTVDHIGGYFQDKAKPQRQRPTASKTREFSQQDITDQDLERPGVSSSQELTRPNSSPSGELSLNRKGFRRSGRISSRTNINDDKRPKQATTSELQRPSASQTGEYSTSGFRRSGPINSRHTPRDGVPTVSLASGSSDGYGDNQRPKQPSTEDLQRPNKAPTGDSSRSNFRRSGRRDVANLKTPLHPIPAVKPPGKTKTGNHSKAGAQRRNPFSKKT